MGHILRLFLGVFITVAGFAIEIIGSSIFEGIGSDTSNLPIPYMEIVQVSSQGFKYLGVFVIAISILGIIFKAITGGGQEDEQQDRSQQQPAQGQQQPKQQQPARNQREQNRQSRRPEQGQERTPPSPNPRPGQDQDRDDQF